MYPQVVILSQTQIVNKPIFAQLAGPPWQLALNRKGAVPSGRRKSCAIGEAIGAAIGEAIGEAIGAEIGEAIIGIIDEFAAGGGAAGKIRVNED